MASSELIGTDALRGIARRTRGVTHEVEEPGQRVVAWVLARQLEALADRWEAEPMSVEEWNVLVGGIRTEVKAAVAYLTGSSGVGAGEAVRVASALIDLSAPAGKGE